LAIVKKKKDPANILYWLMPTIVVLLLLPLLIFHL